MRNNEPQSCLLFIISILFPSNNLRYDILRKKYNALNENATDTQKNKYLSNGQELSSTANINELPPILPI